MATKTVHKHVQIKMFVGAGLAALAMAFGVACETDAAAEQIVVERSFPAAAAVDIVQPYFVKDIPDPMRELGRSDVESAPAAYVAPDVVDIFRELGRYAEVVSMTFPVQDIPDPMREIGHDDLTLTTELSDSQLLQEIGRAY